MSDDTLDVEDLDADEAGKAAGKPARKPGLLSGIGQRAAGLVPGGARGSFFNLRNAALGLLVLLVVWLLVANGAPVRVVLFFWAVDVPKWLAFVVDLALGALLMWLWVRWRGRGKTEGEARP